MAQKKHFNNNELGGRFKHLCFVGLNRVEVHIAGNNEPVFGEHWQDVTDDQSRKGMAMCFFAPREIGGEEQDPYFVLANSNANTPEEEQEARTMTKQLLGDQPLIDLNRFTESAANTVHFVVVADVIFHWDSAGAYIQPTTQSSWVRDLQQLIKGYPRQATMHLYTDWDSEKLGELELKKKPIRSLPLYPDSWINMPTFQDKYGMLFLLAGLIAAGGALGTIHMQQQKINRLNTEIRQLESSMPRGGNLANLASLLENQESQMMYRKLVPLVVKDVAYAMQTAGMEAESLKIENPDTRRAPHVLLAEITAARDAYQGWLQEEPIAKGLLSHSSLLEAIRKPPGGGKFTLEGLIDMRAVEKQVNQLLKDEGFESLEDAQS